ncbi:MAG: lysostaphin resistance A-like protein [Planctomycetota bacterium]
MIAAAPPVETLVALFALAGIPVLVLATVFDARGRLFPSGRSRAHPPQRPGEALGVGLALFAGVCVAQGVLQQLGMIVEEEGRWRPTGPALLCTTAVALAGTVVAHRLFWRRLARPAVRPGGLVVQGALAFLAVLPVVYGLGAAVETWLGVAPDQESVRVVEQRGVGWWGVIPFALLAAPWMEEMVFRGALFSGLRARLGPQAAAALSSVAFGAVHADWGALIPLTAFGVFLCWLVERTGSLLPSVTAHFLFNALSLAALL